MSDIEKLKIENDGDVTLCNNTPTTKMDVSSGIGAKYWKSSLNMPTEVERLRAEHEKLLEELDLQLEHKAHIRAENEKLRAETLEAAAMMVDQMKIEIANGQGEYSLACIHISRRLRAAAAALKETEE